MDYRSVLILSVVLCLLLVNLADVSTALTNVRPRAFQPASPLQLAGQRHRRRRRRQDLQPQQDQMTFDNFNPQANNAINLQSDDTANMYANAVPDFDPNVNAGDITQKKKRK